MASAGPKSSKQLYRDCMRLIKHMAGTSSTKAIQLRKIVADGFRANKHVSDPAQLHALKQSAERGLSNYLIFERSKTDPKLAAAAAEVEPFEDDADGNLVRVVDSSRRTVVKNPYTRPTPEEEAAAEAAVGAGGGARRRKAAASSSSSSGAGAGSGAGGAGAAPKKSSGKVAAGGAGSAGSKAGSVSGLDQGSGAQPMR